mmetsp:Transcript_110044/g.351026  ORF Transcript_110044/g.351026 Transcript_110044/m.351026 type:complete len:291 (+) Transcript_110044:337-1209(+)
MDDLEVQHDPEFLPGHCQRLVVDDTEEGDALELVHATPVGTELLQEPAAEEQAQDAGEGLDVLELEVGDQGLQLWQLVHAHGETVGAHTHDAVQKEDPRRVLFVVCGGVVVAEHEVVHEGAVRVLHGEVALLRHEVREGLVDAWCRGDAPVGRLDVARCALGPEEVVPDLGLHDEAGDRACHGLEDSHVQVKRVVGDDHQAPNVVCGPSMCKGGLPPNVVPDAGGEVLPRVARGLPRFAIGQRPAADGAPSPQGAYDKCQNDHGRQPHLPEHCHDIDTHRERQRPGKAEA